MKKMIIFEPAMCCPTGVCGPSVNPELLKISTLLNNLKSNGIVVERHNLSSNPQAFVDNKTINEMLNNEGIDVLPVIMVDEVVVKTKAYPTSEEFCKFLEIPETYLKLKIKLKKTNNCGCNDGCC